LSHFGVKLQEIKTHL